LKSAILPLRKLWLSSETAHLKKSAIWSFKPILSKTSFKATISGFTTSIRSSLMNPLTGNGPKNHDAIFWTFGSTRRLFMSGRRNLKKVKASGDSRCKILINGRNESGAKDSSFFSGVAFAWWRAFTCNS